MLIGWDIYDVIGAKKKRLGHVAITQSTFRPGSDHTSFLGTEILRYL